jgi:hypothetical protein
MKNQNQNRRVSVTLHPDIAAELDSFVEAWNDRSFPFYRWNDRIAASDAVKFAVWHLLDDIKKAHHGLVHEGMKLEGAIESFWREKIWWEQNSMRDETESETPAEILNIKEGMK